MLMSHRPRVVADMVLLMVILRVVMLVMTLVLELLCHSQLSILPMSATIHETIVVLLMRSVIYIVRVVKVRLRHR